MGDQKANRSVAHHLETFFYWWGCKVASHPWKIILATLSLTGLTSLGLVNFKAETDGFKLWLGEKSHHSQVLKWKNNHYSENIRATITIFTHEENVLTSEGLLYLLDLHQKVQTVEFEGGNFTRACMKIPITNILLADKRRRKRQVDEYSDYQEDYFNFYSTDKEDTTDHRLDTLENLPKQIYCDIVETLEDKCGEYSLLEMWKYDREVISSLTEQEIINSINTMDTSPVFGYSTNFINYLGQVECNSTGHAVKAKSVRSIWLEQIDPEDIPKTQEIRLTGIQLDRVDPFTLGYEQKLLKILTLWKEMLNKEDRGYSMFMNLGLSFQSETSDTIEYDIQKQVIGYMLMFSYALLSLGKPNLIENKFYLAAAGITSVFFGIISGIALTMTFGWPYTITIGVLPFICLGIGIDDMFVIIRCYENIPKEERKTNNLVHNIGLAMKHAGTSITVTSLTDICAFGTGALSFFQGVQSFCIAGAISLTFIFLFQTTWFVACLTLDQKRIKQKQNGLIPCLKHKEWEPSTWSQNNQSTIVMSKVALVFKFPIFQAFIILATLGMLSFGIWGACEISFEYDMKTQIPEDSYLHAWFEQNDLNFPTDGYGVNFFTQEISYSIEDFSKIEKVISDLDNLTKTHNEWVHYGKNLPQTVQTQWESATGFWWTDLKEFMKKHKYVKDWREAFPAGQFPLYLSDFLHHEDGSIYNNSFRFSDTLECNMAAPTISATKLGTLRFRELNGLSNHLPAQKAITEILSRANLSSKTFAYSYVYPVWEIEERLSKEFYQNVGIALACVIIISLISLSDLRAILLTITCVIFTLVDILGASYFMGMTIDVHTANTFIIGIGLSVDYGAHIAHSYSVSKGFKNQRAISGFISISPAIIHGGISTFLALVPIAFSKTYVFLTFFKLLSLTVFLGLFHGLLYQTVMLELFGTNNLNEANQEKEKQGADNQGCASDTQISEDYQTSGGARQH